MSPEKEISNRQLRRAKMRKAQMRSRAMTIGLVVIGTLLVGFVLVYPNVKQTTGIVTVEPRVYPQHNKNSMGDSNAPVKFEEYSDYQCPYCKIFNDQILPQLVETYVVTNEVYFIHHSTGNWISNNIGLGKTESEDAAQAAYCAGDQNKFWELHAALYANWLGEDVGSYTDSRIMAIAESVGLDMNQFKECYEGNKYAQQVKQDLENALAAGIEGTPTFVLSYTDIAGQTITKLVQNSRNFDDFKKEIDAALAATGK